MTVRTRVAPSPTGDPHVGTAYIALLNYCFARAHGGQFLLRIEDTDQTRSTPESEQAILDSLRWLGLEWDEGPDVGGEHGPYRQSERMALYAEHAQQLVQAGKAFICYRTSQELNNLREARRAAGNSTALKPSDLKLDPVDAEKRREAGDAYVIRMMVPEEEGTCAIADMLRGTIELDWSMVDAQILLKSDGMPTYHLANVVDDIEFGITHVVRAEEWLISTPKHVLIYQALDHPLPRFFHVPLLRNADHSKISKRKNPVSLDWFREQGYLKEAILNFLALMGWSPPDEEEVFDLDRFQQEFNIEKISTGAPVFDLVKLDWINGMHIRRMEPQVLLQRLADEGFLPPSVSPEDAATILPLVTERMVRLAEFRDRTDWYFADPIAPTCEQLIPKKGTRETSLCALEGARELFGEISPFEPAAIEAALEQLLDQHSLKKPQLFMPLRWALTSRQDSPGLIEVIVVLGKDRAIERIQRALEILVTTP